MVYLVAGTTKNGEPRIIPVHPKCACAMHIPMPRRSEIDYYWPLARAACGLEHVRLHDHGEALEQVVHAQGKARSPGGSGTRSSL